VYSYTSTTLWAFITCYRMKAFYINFRTLKRSTKLSINILFSQNIFSIKEKYKMGLTYSTQKIRNILYKTLLPVGKVKVSLVRCRRRCNDNIKMYLKST
jgi:hypothetical protein